MTSRPDLAAFVFDAYGTLFDVHSVIALAESLAPGQGNALSRTWRTKQLEYSWLQSLMATPVHPREDFAAITAHALDYAVAALALPLDGAARQRLLGAYLRLSPYPDARPALRALAPRPRLILSNGTRAMLAPVVAASGFAAELDAVLSVDDAGLYKPAPAVYCLATAHLALPPARIGFVSSNGWDAAGAKTFGFHVFWVNRAKQPVERLGVRPDETIADLSALVDLLKD